MKVFPCLSTGSKKGCGVSSLEMLKSYLVMVLDNLLKVVLLNLKELDQMDQEVPSNLNHFGILRGYRRTSATKNSPGCSPRWAVHFKYLTITRNSTAANKL